MQYVKGIGIGILGALLIVPIVFARSANDPGANNWALEQIGAPRAWELSTGSHDVIVAVIDNGFDYLHPELFPNTWKNTGEIPGNGIDDDNNGYIDDVWGWDFSIADRNNDGDSTDDIDIKGDNDPRPDIEDFVQHNNFSSSIIHHGTVVAGIIGAKGNNGRDGAGVNWNVRLMNIRLIGNSGFAEQTSIADSIYYAVDNGADVINFSVVTEELGASALEALRYAYNQGVVVVSAAGNDRVNLKEFPYYPICADEYAEKEEILGVSAIREGRAFAEFSNYGSNCIDITAPGVGLQGTLVYEPEVGLTETYGGNWQGTSFSAPFVSGAAALIKSVQPTWGPDEIFETLLKTTSKSPTDDEAGYRDLFGSGLLQLDKALEWALRVSPETAITPQLLSIQTISFSQGSSRLKNSSARGLAKIREAESLQGIDDIDRVVYAGAYVYATTKYTESSQSVRIQLLDENFEVFSSFETPALGEYAIAVADFVPEFEGVEVAIVPTHPNNEMFQVYSEKGTSIGSNRLAEKHQGVVVSVSNQNSSNIPQIVVAYSQEIGKSIVQQYDLNNTPIKEFTVDSVERIGDLIAADINGDRVDEYIIASSASEPARLVYYSSEGTQLRKFLPYNGGESVKMNLESADFNMDGKADVLVSSENSLHPVRIWTDKSKKLLTWYPVHTFLLPVKRFFFNDSL